MGVSGGAMFLAKEQLHITEVEVEVRCALPSPAHACVCRSHTHSTARHAPPAPAAR